MPCITETLCIIFLCGGFSRTLLVFLPWELGVDAGKRLTLEYLGVGVLGVYRITKLCWWLEGALNIGGLGDCSQLGISNFQNNPGGLLPHLCSRPSAFLPLESTIGSL